MRRTIHLFGLNHRTADVASRERFALTGRDCPVREVVPLDGEISEALVLSTCNRVEILAVADNGRARETVLEHWARHCGSSRDELEPLVYAHSGEHAVAHVFRVAAGLDSLVLGEPQILGQLKDAYRKAVEEKAAKAIVNRLLHKAFTTAKRVRSETGVAASAVSVSSAAVSLAKRIFGDLAGCPVLVVGAGEMAELAAVHLAEGHRACLSFTNRTHERAVVLAARFKGAAVPFSALDEQLERADIVITSTGAPEPLIRRESMARVMKRRRERPLFLIDIAVPRDVEDAVNSLDNVYLYNIDDLAQVAEAGMAARREEAVRAEAIVAEETERFLHWMRTLGLQRTIADMVRKTDAILEEEIAKTLRRLGPVPRETEDALRQLAGAVVKKVNHDPIAYLKRRCHDEEAGLRLVTVARSMFNLDDETVAEDAHLGRKPSSG